MSAAFRCLVCHGAEKEPVFLGCEDYYLRKPVRVDYHRCRTCGLLQQFPLPDDVSSFYEDYPIHEEKSRLYDMLRRLVMGRVYYDARSLRPGSVLLDYGCGDGSYLRTLDKRGFELLGYENDLLHAKRLTERLRIPVRAELSELRASHGGRVDAVTMHFVLEHLTSLDSAFAEVRALLKPAGTFYFVVPCIDSLEARIFGRRWHNLDPPRHVSFPDIGGVRQLSRRHGFTVADERPVPFPNGFAASLPVVVSGRFRFSLFSLFLPLGILFSRLAPSGSHAYRLVRE